MTPVRAVLCRNVVPIIVVVNSQLNVAYKEEVIIKCGLTSISV